MNSQSYQVAKSEDPEYGSQKQPKPTEDTEFVDGNLFSRMKKARETASNPADFLRQCTIILCSSVFVTIMILIFSALPLTLMILGIIYKDDCPIERKIPIWMIVTGSITTVISLIKGCVKFLKALRVEQKEEKPNLIVSCISSIISLFMFAWFITGSVYVYGNFERVTFSVERGLATYCNKTAFIFSFFTITFGWSSLVLCIFCCICAVAFGSCGNSN